MSPRSPLEKRAFATGITRIHVAVNSKWARLVAIECSGDSSTAREYRSVAGGLRDLAGLSPRWLPWRGGGSELPALTCRRPMHQRDSHARGCGR